MFQNYIHFVKLLYFKRLISLIILTNLCSCSITLPADIRLEDAILITLSPKSSGDKLQLLIEESSLNKNYNLKPIHELFIESSLNDHTNFSVRLDRYLQYRKSNPSDFVVSDPYYHINSEEFDLIKEIYAYFKGKGDLSFAKLLEKVASNADEQTKEEIRSILHLHSAFTDYSEGDCKNVLSQLAGTPQATSLALESLALEISCKISLGFKDLGETLNAIVSLPEAKYAFISLIPSLNEESSGIIDLMTIRKGLSSLSIFQADKKSFELYLVAYATAYRRLIGATLSSINLAVQKDPDFASAKMFMARIMIALNHAKSSLEVLNSIPPHQPLYVPARLQAALVARKIGLNKDSFAILKTAIEQRGGTKSLWQAISNPNLAENREFNDFQKAAAIKFAKDFKINYNRGQFLHSIGKRRQSRALLSRTLTQTNDIYQKAEIANFLAYSYIGDNNIRKAYQYSNLALSLVPDDGYFLDTLGWTYSMDGKLEKAEETLTEAVKLAKEDPIIWYHFAKTLEKLDRPDFINAYKKALAFGIQQSSTEFEKYKEEISQKIQRYTIQSKASLFVLKNRKPENTGASAK